MKTEVNVGLAVRYSNRGVEAAQADAKKVTTAWQNLNQQIHGALAGSRAIRSITAANLLTQALNRTAGAVRDVIQNVENIPEVPESTVESVVRLREAMEKVEEGIKRVIAGAVGMFADFGEWIGYAVARVMYGNAAVEAAIREDEDRRRKRLEDMAREAEATRREAEERRAAAQAAREQAEADRQIASAADRILAARRALAQIGETPGAAAMRVQAEMASLIWELSRTADSVKRAELEADIAGKRLEYERLLASLRRRAELHEERVTEAFIARLPVVQQIAVVEQQIADLREAHQNIVGDSIVDEERRLELREKILAAEIRLEDLRGRAALGAAPGIVAPPMAGLPSRLARAEGEWGLLQMREDVGGIAGAWRGVTAAMLEYRTSLGTVEDQWANLSGSIIWSMEDGIATALEGLIAGTKRWEEALRSIGQTILTAVLQAMVHMVAQWVASWIAGQIAMLAAHKASASARLEVTAAEAKASLGMWAPPAMAASTATGGAAPAIGAGTLLAALAVIAGMAVAVSGRERGGPVRAGMPYIVGERRPELFVPALDGMILPTVPDGMTGSHGGRAVNVAVFERRSSMRQWLESLEGEAAMIEIGRGGEARFT